MSNFMKRLAVFAFTVVFGLVMAGCETDETQKHNDGIAVFSVEQTDGRFTIIGLDDHNGKYVAASGLSVYPPNAVNKSVFAAAGISDNNVTGSLISNGRATLNVWEYASETELINLKSTVIVEFSISLFTQETFTLDECNFLHEDFRTLATLYSGVGTGLLAKVNQTTGSLTITGLGEYNDSYLIALGADGAVDPKDYLYAASSISNKTTGSNTVNSAKITDGSATLKVWKAVTDAEQDDKFEFGNFDGNGVKTFRVYIIYVSSFVCEYHPDRNTDTGHEHGYLRSIAARDLQATFTNGIGSCAVEL